MIRSALLGNPASWTDAPRAAALLADCAADPPARKHHVDTYALTADHWSEYSRRDPRVAELHRLWDRAFMATDRAGEEAGEILRLTPEKAIAQAIEDSAAIHSGMVKRKRAA